MEACLLCDGTKKMCVLDVKAKTATEIDCPECTPEYDPDEDERFNEPDQNDEVKCCPDCERPNQFGELCLSCEREQIMDGYYEAADRAYDLQVEGGL